MSTDFEKRIGPRAATPSPDPEPKPRSQNKSWIRPGYHATSPKSPRKLHSRHRSDNKSLHNGSPSPKSELSLLDRIDLRSSPSPRPVFENSLTTRSGVEAIPAGYSTRSDAIPLGRHRIDSISVHEAASRARELPGTNDEGGGSGKVDICASQRQSQSVHSPSTRPTPPAPHSPAPKLIPSHTRNGPLITSGNDHPYSMPSTPYVGSKPPQQGTCDPDPTWYHSTLKDKIAQFVKENANLRLMHCRHEGDNRDGSLFVNEGNVDAVLTPDICNSIIDSLHASRVQIAEASTTQFSTGRDINLQEKSKPEASNSPQPYTVTPYPPSPHPPEASMPATFSFDTRQENNNIVFPASSVSATSSSTPHPLPPHSLNGSIAPSACTQQKEISIPIVPAFFNQIPIRPPLVNPPSSISHSSDRSRLEHDEGSRPTRRRSPSFNSRSCKCSRSRSTSSSSSHRCHKEKQRSPGGEKRRNTSSARRGRSPTSSISSISHKRDAQYPLRVSRRSKSPLFRRSRSPAQLRRSQSPPIRELNHQSNGHSLPRSSYNIRSSPRYREVEPRCSQPTRGSSRDRDSLTSTTSSYSKSTYTKPVRKPYLTAFEREERVREELQQENERWNGQLRRSSSTEKHDKRGLEASLYAGQNIVDKVQINVTEPSSVLPTPPTSASITDRGPTPRQIGFGEKINMSKSRSDGAHKRSNSQSSEGKRAPNAIVGLSDTGLDTCGSSDIQMTQEADLKAWKPLDDIPGIWLFRQGSNGPDVVEEFFEISAEISDKWQIPLAGEGGSIAHQPGTLAELLRTTTPKLSWKLLCIPTDFVAPVRQFLSNPRTSGELVQELSQLQSQWPPEGKLIIEFNPDHNSGKTLYAMNLVATPSVELKDHVHSGSNLVRFIQLGDMSKYVFLLYAAPVSYLLKNGPSSEHDFSLDNLQMVLQRSRIDNAQESTALFGAHAASVRLLSK